MKISVIIPTFNRSQFISITIESILNQSFDSSDYEIIIVNNNSTDNTQQVLEVLLNKYPSRIKLFFEVKQGVHFARNFAAKNATGEILYFTDDDMIADYKMLENIWLTFNEDKDIGVVTGKILPKWLQVPPNWITQYCNNYLLSLNDLGDGLIISHDDIGAFSCHQAILKTVFFKTGGFNPENTNGIWIGDGETGLNIKIKSLGYKFAYNGNAIIEHMIPASRMNQSYLNKRFANDGNSTVYSEYKLKKHKKIFLLFNIFSSIFKMIYNVCALMKILLKNFIKAIVLDNGENNLWRIKLGKVHFYLSKSSYFFKLLTNKERRELVIKENWLNE